MLNPCEQVCPNSIPIGLLKGLTDDPLTVEDYNYFDSLRVQTSLVALSLLSQTVCSPRQKMTIPDTSTLSFTSPFSLSRFLTFSSKRIVSRNGLARRVERDLGKDNARQVLSQKPNSRHLEVSPFSGGKRIIYQLDANKLAIEIIPSFCHDTAAGAITHDLLRWAESGGAVDCLDICLGGGTTLPYPAHSLP
jgi:hypothetical protein